MKFQFADCVLDTGRHAFHRNAVLIPLEPQVFDLLHLLARKAGKLVLRDEMMAEIWDGRIVSESTVSARINAARRAVGDTGKLQHIIKTVPRRGFQMVAKVVADNGPAPEVPDVGLDQKRLGAAGKRLYESAIVFVYTGCNTGTIG